MNPTQPVQQNPIPRKLALTFHHDTYDFTQEWRNDQYALYAKTKKVFAGKKIYEFWKIKIGKPIIIDGIEKTPLRELRPREEDFGKYAWSCAHLQDAARRVKEVGGSWDCNGMNKLIC